MHDDIDVGCSAFGKQVYGAVSERDCGGCREKSFSESPSPSSESISIDTGGRIDSQRSCSSCGAHHSVVASVHFDKPPVVGGLFPLPE